MREAIQNGKVLTKRKEVLIGVDAHKESVIIH